MGFRIPNIIPPIAQIARVGTIIAQAVKTAHRTIPTTTVKAARIETPARTTRRGMSPGAAMARFGNQIPGSDNQVANNSNPAWRIPQANPEVVAPSLFWNTPPQIPVQVGPVENPAVSSIGHPVMFRSALPVTIEQLPELEADLIQAEQNLELAAQNQPTDNPAAMLSSLPAVVAHNQAQTRFDEALVLQFEESAATNDDFSTDPYAQTSDELGEAFPERIEEIAAAQFTASTSSINSTPEMFAQAVHWNNGLQSAHGQRERNPDDSTTRLRTTQAQTQFDAMLDRIHLFGATNGGNLEIQAGDTLWDLGAANAELLLTESELAQFPEGSVQRTNLAKNRLIELNGLNPALEDGVATNAPGDPDMLTIGQEVSDGSGGDYNLAAEVISGLPMSPSTRAYADKALERTAEAAFSADLTSLEEGTTQVQVRWDQLQQALMVSEIAGSLGGSFDDSHIPVAQAQEDYETAVHRLYEFQMDNGDPSVSDPFATVDNVLASRIEVDATYQARFDASNEAGRDVALLSVGQTDAQRDAQLVTAVYEFSVEHYAYVDALAGLPLEVWPGYPASYLSARENLDTVLDNQHTYAIANSAGDVSPALETFFRVRGLALPPDLQAAVTPVNEAALLRARAIEPTDLSTANATTNNEHADLLVINQAQADLLFERDLAIQVGNLELADELTHELTELEILKAVEIDQWIDAGQQEFTFIDSDSIAGARQRELARQGSEIGMAESELLNEFDPERGTQATGREALVDWADRTRIGPISFGGLAERLVPSEESFDRFGLDFMSQTSLDRQNERFASGDRQVLASLATADPQGVRDAVAAFNTRNDGQVRTDDAQRQHQFERLDILSERAFDLRVWAEELPADPTQSNSLIINSVALDAVSLEVMQSSQAYEQLLADSTDDAAFADRSSYYRWQAGELEKLSTHEGSKPDSDTTLVKNLNGAAAELHLLAEVSDQEWALRQEDNAVAAANELAQTDADGPPAVFLYDLRTGEIVDEMDLGGDNFKTDTYGFDYSLQFNTDAHEPDGVYFPAAGNAPHGVGNGQVIFVESDENEWQATFVEDHMIDFGEHDVQVENLVVSYSPEGDVYWFTYDVRQFDRTMTQVGGVLNSDQAALWDAAIDRQPVATRFTDLHRELGAAPTTLTSEWRGLIAADLPDDLTSEQFTESTQLIETTERLEAAEANWLANQHSQEARDELREARFAWSMESKQVINQDAIAQRDEAAENYRLAILENRSEGSIQVARTRLDDAEEAVRETAADESIAERTSFEMVNLDENYDGSMRAIVNDNPVVMVQGIFDTWALKYEAAGGGSDPLESKNDAWLFVARNTLGEMAVDTNGRAIFTETFNAETFEPNDLDWEQREMIQPVVDQVWNQAGEAGRVHALPIAYVDESSDALNVQMLYRTENANGTMSRIVDIDGRKYDDENDYRHDNETIKAEGTVMLIMPTGGELGYDNDGHVLLSASDGRVEGRWEKISRVTHFDTVVTVVGVAASVTLIVTTGGAATPLVAAAWMATGLTMAYGAYSSANRLIDAHEDGLSVNPFRSTENAINWVTLVSSVAPMPGVARNGARVLAAPTASSFRTMTTGSVLRNMASQGDDMAVSGLTLSDDMIDDLVAQGRLTANRGDWVGRATDGSPLLVQNNRVFTVATNGASYQGAGNFVNRSNVVASVSGSAGEAYGAYDLATNWNEMSWEQRMTGGLDLTVNGMAFVHGHVLPRLARTTPTAGLEIAESPTAMMPELPAGAVRPELMPGPARPLALTAGVEAPIAAIGPGPELLGLPALGPGEPSRPMLNAGDPPQLMLPAGDPPPAMLNAGPPVVRKAIPLGPGEGPLLDPIALGPGEMQPTSEAGNPITPPATTAQSRFGYIRNQLAEGGLIGVASYFGLPSGLVHLAPWLARGTTTVFNEFNMVRGQEFANNYKNFTQKYSYQMNFPAHAVSAVRSVLAGDITIFIGDSLFTANDTANIIQKNQKTDPDALPANTTELQPRTTRAANNEKLAMFGRAAAGSAGVSRLVSLGHRVAGDAPPGTLQFVYEAAVGGTFTTTMLAGVYYQGVSYHAAKTSQYSPSDFVGVSDLPTLLGKLPRHHKLGVWSPQSGDGSLGSIRTWADADGTQWRVRYIETTEAAAGGDQTWSAYVERRESFDTHWTAFDADGTPHQSVAHDAVEPNVLPANATIEMTGDYNFLSDKRRHRAIVFGVSAGALGFLAVNGAVKAAFPHLKDIVGGLFNEDDEQGAVIPTDLADPTIDSGATTIPAETATPTTATRSDDTADGETPPTTGNSADLPDPAVVNVPDTDTEIGADGDAQGDLQDPSVQDTPVEVEVEEVDAGVGVEAEADGVFELPAGVVTVQTNDNLWNIAKTNVPMLLTAQARAQYQPGSNQETLAALYRLFEINPERGFDAMLLDGVPSNEVGDPDSVIIGWQLNVFGHETTNQTENIE